jgi:cytochrome c biogenesis protein CcmG/thiol:disulfide interchange protein DsbE
MYKILAILMLCFAVPCMAQNQLPATKIKTLAGIEAAFNTVAAGDTAIVVSFWATWCIPCITELETINDELPRLRKAVPFKYIAISVDDARTTAKVRSFAKGKGWDFIFYTDANNDLKRALNINDIPHVLIIKKGQIVYQHTGYVPGDEEELYTKLTAL